jgi:small-conductance mechanosensitive channel
MGDTAMVFRVRWWIESYRDTRQMFDKVHTALQHALNEAGIESPFPTQTLNLQFASQTAQPSFSGAAPSAGEPGEGMTASGVDASHSG